MVTLAQLRASFLDFFKRRGHEVVVSSSLVPGNDPTLLFTNAGMVQFKDVFLGLEKRPYLRAASSQRCVRAGGKHNDLENVGFTARHHTFFEMLGNFSFGDYFKEDAIKYAWEFLTEALKLPPEKLWVTVYAEDTEAADIWLKKIGIDKNRFARIATKDNFWQMGDTGPCGPCSEIFYDHGPGVAGGPPGSDDADGDRYIEIWNLVFMQYNRSADGKLTPLPKPSVDTGMGLERLVAVMQGVHSNYEIDLFKNLLNAAAKAVGIKNEGQSSLRVIVDHIRSCSFLIADGVVPSNEGRGYVLRRIIRRAIRHGHKLGCKDTFFHKLVKPLAREMGDAYPELISSQSMIEKTLNTEEERFAQTLENGLLILNETFSGMKGKTVPGDVVFKLYDTYGFPVDLTADIARERGYQLDTAGFERAMEEQRALARSSSQFSADLSRNLEIKSASEFIGYDHLHGRSEIKYLLRDNKPVDSLNEGDNGIVVLARTPFYAESGGQVGDRGELHTDNGMRFRVEDTQKYADAILHIGRVVSGSLHRGLGVNAEVDAGLRRSTIQNHSATHLLHAALRQVLGTHVQQKGSLVNEHRLRFDFSHTSALTPDEIRKIEFLVNEQIQANHQAQGKTMSLQDAKKSGAMALFGEKYGDQVRVMSMGGFSVELCGGTHVSRTGDIGLFRIIAESGVAAGVRRIEAATGMGALNLVYQTEARLDRVGAAVKADREQIEPRVLQLAERNRELEKELQKLKARLAERSTGGGGGGITEQAVEIAGVRVVAECIDGADSKILRDTLDQLKQKLKTAVIVLAAVENEKVLLVAGVTKDTVARVHAGELVNYVAEQLGGKGGGRPDMAQAGGVNSSALQPALQSVSSWVKKRLA
jgi:alanyl-tRNA synthetase